MRPIMQGSLCQCPPVHVARIARLYSGIRGLHPDDEVSVCPTVTTSPLDGVAGRFCIPIQGNLS